MKTFQYTIKIKFTGDDGYQKSQKHLFKSHSSVHDTAEKEFTKKMGHLKDLQVFSCRCDGEI